MANTTLGAPWNWIIPVILLSLWIVIFFILLPVLCRKDLSLRVRKEVSKYCLFADRFVNLKEIVYMYNFGVLDFLVCFEGLAAVLNQHNYRFDSDRFITSDDFLVEVDSLYSDSKFVRYFEKRSVAKFLKKWEEDVNK